MIYCSNCGTSNRDGSRFCNECGARLGSFQACPTCNFPNLTTARFCNGCGQTLSPATKSAHSSSIPTEQIDLDTVDDEPPESEVPTLNIEAIEFGGPRPPIGFGAGSKPIAPAAQNVQIGDPHPSPLPEGERTIYPAPSAIETSDAMSELLFMDMLGEVETAEEQTVTVPDVIEVETDKDTISEVFDAADLTEESRESEIQVEESDEEQEEAIAIAKAPAVDSLPTWMREDDLIEDIAESRNPLDSPSSSGLAIGRTTAAESEASIELARSFSYERLRETSDAETTAFKGAGAAFSPIMEQPWQPLNADDRSPSTSSRAKGKAANEPGASSGTRRLRVLLIVAIVLAIVALVYIMDGTAARGATDSLSGTAANVIASMLALAGQN